MMQPKANHATDFGFQSMFDDTTEAVHATGFNPHLMTQSKTNHATGFSPMTKKSSANFSWQNSKRFASTNAE
jgi:hypothetical protein